MDLWFSKHINLNVGDKLVQILSNLRLIIDEKEKHRCEESIEFLSKRMQVFSTLKSHFLILDRMKGFLHSQDGSYAFPLAPKVTTIGRENCDISINVGFRFFLGGRRNQSMSLVLIEYSC